MPREAGDVHLVDHGGGEGPAQRSVAFPVVGIGIDDHAPHGDGRVVARAARRFAIVTVRHRDGASVGIEQELLGIEAKPARRIEGADRAVRVDLAGTETRHEGVPVVVGPVDGGVEPDHLGRLGDRRHRRRAGCSSRLAPLEKTQKLTPPSTGVAPSGKLRPAETLMSSPRGANRPRSAAARATSRRETSSRSERAARVRGSDRDPEGSACGRRAWGAPSAGSIAVGADACHTDGGCSPGCEKRTMQERSPMSPPGPFQLASPSGLAVQVNANASIRRIDLRDVILNAFLGNEMEGGPANLYLRRRGETHRLDSAARSAQPGPRAGRRDRPRAPRRVGRRSIPPGAAPREGRCGLVLARPSREPRARRRDARSHPRAGRRARRLRRGAPERVLRRASTSTTRRSRTRRAAWCWRSGRISRSEAGIPGR